MVRFRLGLVVLLAACGLAALPTVGLARHSDAQNLRKLVELTGSGHKSSGWFRIKSSTVQVAYSYGHCPAKGGNLVISLVRPRVTKILFDVAGSGGKKRVPAYPKPWTYHLSVDSNCRWYVAIYGH